MLAHQRLALGEHDGLDELGHELPVPFFQLRHFAAPEQFLTEVLVGQHVQLTGQVVLVEGVVACPVAGGVDDAAAAEEFAPGVIAVTGQQRIVEIE